MPCGFPADLNSGRNCQIRVILAQFRAEFVDVSVKCGANVLPEHFRLNVGSTMMKQKTFRAGVTALAAAAAMTAGAAHANLMVNGDFSSPNDGGGYSQTAGIPGWLAQACRLIAVWLPVACATAPAVAWSGTRFVRFAIVFLSQEGPRGRRLPLQAV